MTRPRRPGGQVGLASTARGHGPRLVLVHGFTQTAGSWDRAAAALADRFEVVQVDAPGHGRSGGVDADLWQAADLLHEVGGRATYAGYSMGARLCLHVALAHPEAVAGLVLLGGTPGIEDPGERQARRDHDEALATRLEAEGVDAFLAWWLGQPMFAGLPDDPDDRAARATNTPAGLASSLRRCGTGVQEPLWHRLGEITVPTLVLAGEHDTKFAAIAERMAAHLGGPTRRELVPGAGHAAHLENPTAFLALLTTWLEDAVRGEPR